MFGPDLGNVFVPGSLPDDYFKIYFKAIANIDLGSTADHHLIPAMYARGKTLVAPVVYDMLGAVTSAGYFSIVDGRLNAIILPIELTDAKITGRALHDNAPGPRNEAFHRQYNVAVGAAIVNIQAVYYAGQAQNDATYQEVGAELAGLQGYLEENLSPFVFGAIGTAALVGLGLTALGLLTRQRALIQLAEIAAKEAGKFVATMARLKLQPTADDRPYVPLADPIGTLGNLAALVL